MEHSMRRRDFLKWAGAGAALFSVPFLGGQGRQGMLGSLIDSSAAAAGGGQYFDRFGMSEAVFRNVLAKGLSRGGDFCELYFEHTISRRTAMEDGQINRAAGSVDLGAGIRVLKGDATGYAYCEDLTEAALLAAAETAAAVADGGPAASCQPIAISSTPNHYSIRVPWSEVGIDRKIPIIERLNASARAASPNLVRVSVALADDDSHILVVNSEGLMVEDYRPMALISLTCVGSKDGRTESYRDTLSGRTDIDFFTEERIDDHARYVVSMVEEMFTAIDPPVGELPVVMAPAQSGILLHEAMGHPMEADFNRKGISMYSNSIGQKIANEHVTIVDDGTNPHMRGSLNIDDEGTPGQRTVLVENGIMRSYLHDRISAKHYGLASTGSGRRQSFRFSPVPRMRNTYMVAGPHDPREIIASVPKGLYAENFSNGQVNIGAGDFTFYLQKGRLIENGKLTSVVKDANLIGNGPKVLASIDMVGTDFALFKSGGTCGKDGQGVPVGFGLPTVRAGAISIGGRKA